MARLFDDASSHVLSIDAAIISGYPFSMGCNFNSDDGTLSQALMAIVDKDVDNQLHMLRIAGGVAGDPLEAISQATGVSSAQTTTGMTVGAWHQAMAVFASATDRRVFIDGGSKGTNTGSRSPSGLDRVSIGARNSATLAQPMSGMIAEAWIYNIALPDSDVQLLRKFSPLLVRPEALIAYWPLVGRFSPEIDIRGANNLTVTGATAAAHPLVRYPASSRRLIAVPSSVGAALEGVLSAAATIVAALTTVISSAGWVQASGNVAGDLTTQIAMAAAVSGQATAGGALTTQVTPAASVQATGSMAGALTTAIPLAGGLSGTGTVAAALDTQITPAASLQAVGSLSGDLTTQIEMAAATNATATLAGELAGGAAQLETSVTAAATLAGALSTSITPAGSVAGIASLAGALSTLITPAASVQAQAALAGALTTAIQCASSLSCSASLVGEMEGAGAALASSISGVASVTADITTQIALAGGLSGTAATTADLLTQLLLGGALEVIGTLNGELEGAWPYGDAVSFGSLAGASPGAPLVGSTVGTGGIEEV